MPKVTIEDISRVTGLSRGTVSRALNNRPDISEKTRQRVLEACRRLKYRPSYAARSLATGRNYAVAVLAERFDSPFAAGFVRGALRAAEVQRYCVFSVEIESWTGRQTTERLTSLALERLDAALIVVPPQADNGKVLNELLGRCPRCCTRALPGWQGDVLGPDTIEAGRLIARFLISRAGREALYLYAPDDPDETQRAQGFAQVARQHGIDPDTVRQPVRGPRGVAEALAGRLDSVRALAASSDALAVSALLVAAQAGRRAGADLAILGHGNTFLGARMQPALSTIDLSAEEVGQRAMQLVLQRIHKERMDAPQAIHVAPRLVERQTT